MKIRPRAATFLHSTSGVAKTAFAIVRPSIAMSASCLLVGLHLAVETLHYLVPNLIELFHGVLPNHVELGVGVLGELGQVSRPLVQEVCDPDLLRLKHGDFCKHLLLALVTAVRQGCVGSSIFGAALADGKSPPA